MIFKNEIFVKYTFPTKFVVASSDRSREFIEDLAERAKIAYGDEYEISIESFGGFSLQVVALHKATHARYLANKELFEITASSETLTEQSIKLASSKIKQVKPLGIKKYQNNQRILTPGDFVWKFEHDRHVLYLAGDKIAVAKNAYKRETNYGVDVWILSEYQRVPANVASGADKLYDDIIAEVIRVLKE